MRNVKHHIILYVFEIIILCSGFIIILNSEFNFWTQFFILGVMLFFYTVIGLLRHTKDNDMHGKVVLEYISISAIIALLFLLVNISRI